MKRQFAYIIAASALVLGGLSSCDNYDRTEVEHNITVNHNSVSLFEGETVQLTASPTTYQFKWSSSDESIATVDGSGLVTAVTQGTASVLCSADGMVFATEVVVNKKIALTDIELRSESVVEMGLGSTLTIPVVMIPAEANDVDPTDFAWWSDDEATARVSDAGEIKAINTGSTTIHYRKGKFTKEVEVVVGVTFPFFKGNPFVISKDAPTEIMYRDFDRGGMGNAFYDTGGGGGNTYRATNGDPTSFMVTIEGGGNIGYLTAGEWYLYTIDVRDAGTYTCTINLASAAGSDGSYRYQVDGVDAWGPSPIPRSGGWGSFIDFDAEFYLPAGTHALKFVADDGEHNPMKMTLKFKE